MFQIGSSHDNYCVKLLEAKVVIKTNRNRRGGRESLKFGLEIAKSVSNLGFSTSSSIIFA